jgi:LmbE family N-acetylglucosaminyl deacetylase
MTWIYLSPHLDDVALSCGGLVWEQAQAGEQVEIWTICAGDPPHGPLSPFAQGLHQRWETGEGAAGRRRAEDLASCARLGVPARHFPLPDCIYRPDPQEAGRFLYASEAAIFGPLHPAEAALVQALARSLNELLEQEARLVCPLALGGHVDHRLARRAAELLDRSLWYYADYPYVLQAQAQISQALPAGWQEVRWPVSAAGMQAWQAAVAAHASQLSTFWPGLEAMQAAIHDYGRLADGARLWRPPLGGST